ncbi:MAG TPA: histidine phosphatase family protein [Woeseiaceae bacterium]|jgi:phosphohistidine phosphatase
MKTLTLLRHAKSSWDEPGLADLDRPLNERGERDVPRMASRLADAGIRPSLILSSPAVRAWTTARLVAREIGYPVEFLQREPRLYLAGVKTLIDVIGQQENRFNNIVIVGHNPGLTEMAQYMMPGVTDNIPTCGLVSVFIDADDWDIRSRDRLSLNVFDFPKKVHD